MGAVTPIGLCIISPAYEKAGREAVRRFQLHTGLECKVHETQDGEESFDAKLSLDRIAGRRPVCFVDSDLWFLGKPNLTFGHPCVLAAHDSATRNPHAFPHTDCERFGMDKNGYINTGLLVFDTRQQKHRDWFREARKLKAKSSRTKKGPKPADWTDQVWLNLAKRNVGLPWSKLPSSYNFYLFEAFWGQAPFIPRKIIGLHGAGIKAKSKFRKLTQQALVFEHPVCPMHPEALAFQHVITHDLR